MGLEDKFNEAVKEWKEHCKKNPFYSSPQPYMDCDAYRKIVAMGPEVLHLIRKEYASEGIDNMPGNLWGGIIHEIIPEFHITESNTAEEHKKKVLNWLDKNINKYTSVK